MNFQPDIDVLSFFRQGKVEELAGGVRVSSASDQIYRPRHVAGALTGSDGLDRRTAENLSHHIVHEGDADAGLAEPQRFDRSDPRLGVLADIAMQFFQVVEALVRAHE